MTTTTLTGFDASLAAVLARRAAGQPCPWTGDVDAPLPTDDAERLILAYEAGAIVRGEGAA